QGALLQVEVAVDFLAHPLVRRPGTGARGERAQIDHNNRDLAGGRNDLDWGTPDRGKRCPERLVAARDLGEAVLQRIRGERPAQPPGNRQVVYRAAGMELIEQPEALLGERERSRALAGAAPRDRSTGRGRAPFAQSPFEERPLRGRKLSDSAR